MTGKRRRLLGHAWLLALSLAGLLLAHWVLARHPLGLEIANTRWGMNIRHYAKFLEQVPRRVHRQADEETPGGPGVRRAATPRLRFPSGIYQHDVDLVVLGAADRTELRYSTNGSVPTRRHPLLPDVFKVDTTSVIRVKAFEPGLEPSETVTANYVIRPNHAMPVVSLVLDPIHLFDKHSGIYRNPRQRGRAWERPVTFFLASPVSGGVLEAEATLRIHGNASRGAKLTRLEAPNANKKSFRLYLKPEEGDLRAWFGSDERFISENQSQWVLRHVPNYRLIHRDRLGQRIAFRMGLLASPSFPCVLYLNGQLWGVYDVMERVNPEFLVGKSPGKRFTLLRGSLSRPKAFSGKQDDWLAICSFVASGDMTDPAVYRVVEEAIDLDNLIDFWILQIFSADVDRPDSNIDVFRSESGDSRWRFIVWDMDGGFNYFGIYTDHDTIKWHLRDHPMPELKPPVHHDTEAHVRSTVLFRNLMKSDGFRQRFVERFSELLQTVLSRDAVLSELDDLLETYASVRELELQRFPGDPAEAGALFDEQIDQIREFLSDRPMVMRQLLQEYSPRGMLENQGSPRRSES